MPIRASRYKKQNVTFMKYFLAILIIYYLFMKGIIMKKLLLTLSALSVITFGGNYEDGLKAYKTGDYEQAVDFWQKAAENGHVEATYNLGCMYASGRGVKQDYKKASEFCQKAAENGYVKALFNLGVMYENGIGVKQDYKKAEILYKKAADQGLAQAKLNLEALQLKRL